VAPLELAPVVLKHIRLARKNASLTSTLAYHSIAEITKAKSYV